MPPYCYIHKQFVPLSDARISVMTNFLHYGTAIFEGIRANWNSQHQQMYIFRLKEHYQRFLNGCKVLKIDIPYSLDELCQLSTELSAKCGYQEDVYLRPLAYKSSESLGVRLHNLESDFLVFAFPWGAYLDTDKAKCGVSSWRRPGSNVAPAQIKATGLYLLGALAKTEAIEHGYDEAILLSEYGYISEGSGENLFLVINGKLVTPGQFDCCLIGITRNTVIELAKKELGIEVIERHIDRTELYNADECFLTGTAAHVTPVTEIDHRTVGNGEIGPVTDKLRHLYADIIKGNNPKYLGWCTPVYKK